MIEYVLIVHLATLGALDKVHSYERNGYRLETDCERAKERLLAGITQAKRGALLLAWCERDTPLRAK